MKTGKDDVGKLLAFDPLLAAEEVSGESYKDDENTAMLGLGMHLMHTQRKLRVLEERDDSTYSTPLSKYERILADLGFVMILEVPFTATHRSEPPREERFRVYWNAHRGVLLHFDTYSSGYGEPHVNGGEFMFNYRPNPDIEFLDAMVWWQGGGSRHLNRDPANDRIYVMTMDCREAVRWKFEQADKNGTFITPWVEKPFLWLVHYGDTEGGRDQYDVAAINAARVALFPPDVRAATGL